MRQISQNESRINEKGFQGAPIIRLELLYFENTSDKIDNNLHKMSVEFLKNDSFGHNLVNLQYPVNISNTIDHNLPSSRFASFFLVLNICLLVPSVYLHFLIVRMVGREKKKVGGTLHGNALAIYAKFVIFTQLMVIININGIMSYIYPASNNVGSWYCYTVEISFHVMGVYTGIFSLLLATMKYWFVVHNEHAKKVGVERSQMVFIIIHILVSTILPLFNAVSNGDVDHYYWVNQCWGNQVGNLEIENNFWNIVGEEFCYFRTYQLNYYIGAAASEFWETCLRILCGGVTMFYILLFSNILELIIYLKLFKHIDRYVSALHKISDWLVLKYYSK